MPYLQYSQKKENKTFQGTAFFINSSGLAISCAHVLENADDAVARISGQASYYDIDKVYFYDKEADVVLFHVNITNNKYITLPDKQPRIGDKVFIINNSNGSEKTFTSGEISHIKENHIYIDTPKDIINNGGALINDKGEVLGVTTNIYDPVKNSNIAISIEAIKNLLIY